MCVYIHELCVLCACVFGMFVDVFCTGKKEGKIYNVSSKRIMKPLLTINFLCS